MTNLRFLLALTALLSTQVDAQDWTAGTTARTLESPAHEALMALKTQPETKLEPFKTDGCSGGLSQVWQVVASNFSDFAKAHRSLPPWEGCCITHDRAYHNASNTTESHASFAARLTADLALQACVIATGSERVDVLANVYDVPPEQIVDAYDSIAQAMFLAVRFGGAPCSGLPWRWGYGYPDCSILSAVFD